MGIKWKEARFWELIQAAARGRGCTFFCDTSEGRDKETPTLYCEDFSGWLVPLEQEEAFRQEWMNGDHERLYDKPWGDCFTFAEWTERDGTVQIAFDPHT